MSYSSIYQNANDQSFLKRLAGAAAQEGRKEPVPDSYKLGWLVAVHSDIEDAYEFALNSGNPDPGGDPAVITDPQILAAVQQHLPDLPPQP